jgi:flagellar motility protein MotE (MotC chaperone)
MMQRIREANRRESEALEERLQAIESKADEDHARRLENLDDAEARFNNASDDKIRRIFEK